MSITREQFIRGFNALKAEIERRSLIEQTAIDAGLQDFNMGSSPVANELEQQLVERCRDRWDDSGPWPEDSYGEGEISLALHYADTPIYDEDHVRQPNLSTAEEVWAQWEATQTGPFRPEVAS